ncbi:hypothetical protein PILCRDRAFT_8970 [Piloderma croceum F 1598]|uniref:Uncharacterized protein n=1 Tax=Piloderma croceum (strain F 1598) TaxID=765440 RepID=A0A0C3F9H6_PILCF|nr:hypothetical protein PILCRDRAFT_8970 [Piloderma croceum F 1598]
MSLNVPQSSFQAATSTICKLMGPGGFLDSQTTDTQFFELRDLELMHGYDGRLGSHEFYDRDSSFIINGNSDSMEATPYRILGSSQGDSPLQADTPLSVNKFGVKAETEDHEEEIEADIKKD